jgi:DNA invertase Pin-like site-specific DNA recombinase
VPIALSYLRVSSPEQAAAGRTGIDRQADAFLPFCHRHGLIPNPDPLVDRGLSAYHGRHRSRGALGAFIHAAEQGQIAPGTVLVVEDLDRFSREAASHSEQLLHQLWDLGLALGIVRDDVVVDRAKYDSDIGVRLQLLVRRDAAHDYSRKLSQRVKAASDRRVERGLAGEAVIPHCRPQWLDFDEQNQAFPLNSRWPTYRRIVDLCLQGFGQSRSAAILNEEGHRNSRGGLWSPAGVGQVLRDRRLIGERQWCELQQQPDGRRKRVPTRVQQGFFPPAITLQEFERCQQLMASRNDYHSRRPHHTDLRKNLLQGVACCPCGELYSLMTQTKPSGKAHSYLVCKAKGKGACKVKNHRYDEPLLLELFMAQRWADFFHQPADSQQRQAAEHQLLALEQQLAQQQQAAATAQQNLASLLTTGQLDTATAIMLGGAVQDAQAAAAATSDQLDAARLQHQQLMARPDGQAMAAQIAARVQAFMGSDRLNPAVRRSFNSWLSTLGIAVELHHQQAGQPLMLVRHVDGSDAVELHQATANGDAVHVRAQPEALHQLWQDHGRVEDGALVLDGGDPGELRRQWREHVADLQQQGLIPAPAAPAAPAPNS